MRWSTVGLALVIGLGATVAADGALAQATVVAQASPKTTLDILGEEWPKTALAALLLVFSSALAWLVGSRVAARWETYKTRVAGEIALSRDFHAVVADFKAAARGWSHLQNGEGGDRDQGIGRRRRAKARSESKAQLLKRAIDCEARLEAILLRVVSEPTLDARGRLLASRAGTLSDDDTYRMSLLRVAYRLLRERIEHDQPTPPYGDPEPWLFNRLVADVAATLAERPSLVPRPGAAGGPSVALSRLQRSLHLELISAREVDYLQAVRRIAPHVAAYELARREDRKVGREANLARLFDAGRTQIGVRRPPGGSVLLLVEFGEDQPLLTTLAGPEFLHQAAAVAHAGFNAVPTAEHHFLIVDRPGRLVATGRGGVPIVLEASNGPGHALPVDLPLAQGIASPIHVMDVLGWSRSSATIDAIRNISLAELR